MSDKTLNCNDCDKTYVRKKSLMNHIQMFHKTIQNMMSPIATQAVSRVQVNTAVNGTVEDLDQTHLDINDLDKEESVIVEAADDIDVFHTGVRFDEIEALKAPSNKVHCQPVVFALIISRKKKNNKPRHWSDPRPV